MLDHLEALAIRVGDRPAKLFLGNGPLALEVVEVPFGGPPRITELRALFRERLGRRAAPVLIVASWGNARAAVCGPTEHNPVEHPTLPMEQVEAVCRKALEAEGRHTAIRLLHQLLPQLDTPIPGLRNGGLFTMQELEHGVPARGDWALAVQEGQALRTLRGRALIQGLRFTTAELPGPAMLLLSGDRKTAVAVLLDQPEEIDSASPRFDGVSPVSYALAQADRENLDYVVVVADATLRLYPAKPGIGTGRRGTFRDVRGGQSGPSAEGRFRISLAPPLRARSLRRRNRRGDPRTKRGLRRGSGKPASRPGLPRGHTVALPCCRVGDVAGEPE